MHGEELVGQVHDGGGEASGSLEETAALLEPDCLIFTFQNSHFKKIHIKT